MSAFCVFGVTMGDCIKRARKDVPNYVIGDLAKKIYLTPDEWDILVKAKAKELFLVARSKQISPAFDTPQFCEDWIAIGRQSNQIRSPKIMCKGKKVDSKGAEIIRKGKQVIGWISYKAAA